MKWDGTDYIYTRVDGTEYRMKDPFPSLTRKYWNLNTPWNLEQKITWDEIAPSLQELILVCRYIEWEDLGPELQERILKDEADILTNTEAITNEVSDREDAISDLQEQLNTLITNVTSMTNRMTSIETTMLSIQNTINTEIKPSLTNLSSRIDALDVDIEKIWGSELYRNDHSLYNIYQIWQKMTELVQRMEALENAMINIQNTIGDYDNRISDLERRVSILETDVSNIELTIENHEARISDLERRVSILEEKVEDLEGRVTILEEKTQIYIDQFITDNGDPDFRFFIHFSNNFCIQSFYSGSCRSTVSFETAQANGYQYYIPGVDASRHGYITQTINPHEPGSKAYDEWIPNRKLFGTVRKIPYPMRDYLVLHGSDETANGTYGLPMPYLSTDQHSITCVRYYDNERILLTTVFADKAESEPDILALGYSGPEIQENGSIILLIGYADKVS